MDRDVDRGMDREGLKECWSNVLLAFERVVSIANMRYVFYVDLVPVLCLYAFMDDILNTYTYTYIYTNTNR